MPKDAAEQTAALLRIHHASLPKLAMLRQLCEQEPGEPLTKHAATAEVKYVTAKRWKRAGLLDPDNYKLKLSVAQRLGPEYNQLIAENAGGIVIEAQRRVLQDLPNASAKDASAIAAQQQGIAHLATGQATSIVEYQTREQLILAMKDAGLLAESPEVIEGEVVEETAAA